MKKIVSILCLSFIGMSLFAYDVATNLQLKGNVKSVTKSNFLTLIYGRYSYINP